MIASKHDVTYGNLVVSGLREYWLAIVKDINSKILRFHFLNSGKFFLAFKQFDVNGCISMVSWTNDNLLLENDSIFSWYIAILILEWLALHNFSECKRFFVGKSINYNLSFVSIVRHDTFNSECITIIIILLRLVVI